MGFINRHIEEYTDEKDIVYFLHGEQPLPGMLLDDIKGVVYKFFRRSASRQRMYLKIDMDKI